MKKHAFDLAALSGLRALNRVPVALAPGFVRVNATDNAPDEAEVFVYGDIGGWFDGVSAEDFAREIGALDVGTINIRLNSPGGLVFDGIAIYNAIASHKANIIVHIEGVAASIASVIAMAGDEIRIGEAATVMIHKPWSIVMGDAESMRKEAEVLDTLEGGILDIYAARTGKSLDELKTMVAAETWLRGQDAVDAGFADVMVPAKKKEKPAKSALLALYNNTPADLKSAVTEDPKVREFERLLREGEHQPNDFAKRVASLASRVFGVERDVPPPVVPRDEDERVATARRIAAAIHSLKS
jgi:ATP-dependent Clp protease, protease subunit